MTAEEIIRLARRQLDDFAEPYLWEDVELVAYLNDAINELCDKTHLITDSSTTAITQIKLLANVGKYSLDERVIWVKGARIEDKADPLVKKTESYMDNWHSEWRETTSIDPTGVTTIVPLMEMNTVQKVQFWPKIYDETGEIIGNADIDFDLTTKKISKVGATFTDHFAVDDEFNVDGTSLNDGYYTVHTVAATEIIVHEALVDELHQSATLRRVEETAYLTVIRYPLLQVDIDHLTLEPELPFNLHLKLIDGIKMNAYEKDDADTYIQQKADRARAKWNKTLDDIKRNRIHRFHAPGAIEFHNGAI
jgi:hypothetical protein